MEILGAIIGRTIVLNKRTRGFTSNTLLIKIQRNRTESCNIPFSLNAGALVRNHIIGKK